MKRTSLLTAFLLSTQLIFSQGAGFLKESIIKWENATQYTLEIVRQMPEDKFDFAPTDDTRTFTQQLIHMSRNMTWLAGDYLGAPAFSHPLQEKDEYTSEEAMEYLEASLKYAKSALEGVKESQLSEVQDFFAGPMSKRQIIALMHDHHTHHRGQVIVYLRLNGIKPARYRGW